MVTDFSDDVIQLIRQCFNGASETVVGIGGNQGLGFVVQSLRPVLCKLACS